MPTSRDRILVVEQDAVVADLIARQALQAAGYAVAVCSDAASAIARALQWSPEVIILDLNLPGLNGKDLMVALSSQGVQTPTILLAQRGMEADIIQAFRLGASDYILLPAREAEVITAVERILKQVNERRERDRLAQKLQQTNQDLQARVRELTAIFAVGKAVTSVTDQTILFDKVLDGAMRVAQADLGWLLLRDEVDKPFILAAERHLPAAVGAHLNQAWDDGIGSLVAMSGEPLSISGDPLKRFKISSLGASALIVPIRVQQKKVIGLLAVMRRAAAAFSVSEQNLLEALADYASISLVNARLFRTIEERARSLQALAEATQTVDRANEELVHSAQQSLIMLTHNAQTTLEKLAQDVTARWRPDQRQLLSALQDSIGQSRRVADALTLRKPNAPKK